MSTAPLTAAERAVVRATARRIGWQTAALVLVVLLLVGSVVVAVVVRSQADDGRRRLESTARTVDDVHDVPVGIWAAVDGPRGREVSVGMPDGLPDEDVMAQVARTGREVHGTATVSGVTYQLVTARSRDGVAQAVLDPDVGQEEVTRLVTGLAVAGACGVLLAGLGGAWIGRRAVRPTAEALALQRRFVADASHELRTPLTLLSTRVQLLRRHLRAGSAGSPSGEPSGATSGETGGAARIEQDVDAVLADTRALAEVLEDMLLAADARSVDPEPVDLVETTQATVDSARAAAGERGIELVREGAATLVVPGSAVPVRRALTALVDNALDHAATEVRVRVEQDGAFALVRVTDDGPGLGADADRLFARFASRRPGDADAPRHYGLGLALVAEVAARHGGTVSAGSRVDGAPGAQLTLRLPLAPARGRSRGRDGRQGRRERR